MTGGRSFWTLSGSPSLLKHPSLRMIAQAKRCIPAQAVFRLAQVHSITPLSGTTSEEHMREDIAAEAVDLSQDLDSDAGTAVRDIERLVWGSTQD